MAAGVAGVVALTALVHLARDSVDVVAAPVLYQLLVLVVSGLFGARAGLVTAGVAVAAFNWFFLEPLYTFTIADSENWLALGVFAVTALVTSRLAAGARRVREESRERRRDADLLNRLTSAILTSIGPGELAPGVTAAAADALEVAHCAVVTHAEGAGGRVTATLPDPDGYTLPLSSGGRLVGLLEVGPALPASDRWRRTDLVGAVAGLLAVAIERNRLIGAAFETETLRRSDELKTALIQGVSHDLRTPLTVIRGTVDGLGRPMPETERAELLAILAAQVGRLERLIGNLLELSRLEGGAITPRLDACDPDDLVGTALAATAGLVPEADVRVQLPDAAPLVTADPVLTERILVNLIHNAATHGRPPIAIEVAARPGWVDLAVEDAGPGLSPAIAGRAFTPFVRGDASPGLGIGLALARGLAEAQGGRLVLDPSRPSRVTLSLPTSGVAVQPA